MMEEFTIPAREHIYMQMFMLKGDLFQHIIRDKDVWTALGNGLELKHRMETWETTFGQIRAIHRASKWGTS